MIKDALNNAEYIIDSKINNIESVYWKKLTQIGCT